MSNSRRKKKPTRDAVARMMARSAGAEPVLRGRMGGYEMWQIGEVMHGVPVIREDPAELKTALALRRKATFAGRCECGAGFTITARGPVMQHTDGCIASNASLDAIAARHGKRSQYLPEDAFDELD